MIGKGTFSRHGESYTISPFFHPPRFFLRAGATPHQGTTFLPPIPKAVLGRSVRPHCLECRGASPSKCENRDCNLFNFNTVPKRRSHTKASLIKALRAECADCLGNCVIAECSSPRCALYPVLPRRSEPVQKSNQSGSPHTNPTQQQITILDAIQIFCKGCQNEMMDAQACNSCRLHEPTDQRAAVCDECSECCGHEGRCNTTSCPLFEIAS